MPERDALHTEQFSQAELVELLDVLWGQARDTRFPVNEALRGAVSVLLNAFPRAAEDVRGAWLAKQDSSEVGARDVAAASGWFDLELTAPAEPGL